MRNIKNKRAEFLEDNTISFIAAAFGVVLIFYLLYLFLVPTINRPEQSAKALAKILEDELQKAEREGIGEIQITKVPSGGEIFIIYFNGQGGIATGEHNEHFFFNTQADKHALSVCYSVIEGKEADSGCKHILTSHGFYLIGSEEDKWVISKGESYTIMLNKQKEQYEFQKEIQS